MTERRKQQELGRRSKIRRAHGEKEDELGSDTALGVLEVEVEVEVDKLEVEMVPWTSLPVLHQTSASSELWAERVGRQLKMERKTKRREQW